MECYILTIRWAAASNLIVSIYNTKVRCNLLHRIQAILGEKMKSANTFYNETCLKWEGLISEDTIDVLINSRLLSRCHNGLITKNELDGFLAQQYFFSN